MSEKVCNFAPANETSDSLCPEKSRLPRSVAKLKKDRDLAQLVAHTSGGREVAGSSPVIPTERIAKRLIINHLAIFLFLISRDFPVKTQVLLLFK